ncbi:hypothetical protein SBA5_290157 [Candidatus Sulfotelmatomonas gaucii]|uniref:Uncharacterized protein n=1 Tax=Candidatus Sulfuritelmatomonas gaucii TaxID=2043161 RepID=A0A2N9LAZ1_9BACT|nr:hypothetical protein SBA5_290157 [Candidatus Sulfotelmatomonas gaucii]
MLDGPELIHASNPDAVSLAPCL